MGTSSMYGGPNRSPLLPPDFDDGGNNNNNHNPSSGPEQNPSDKSPEGDQASPKDPVKEPGLNNTSTLASQPQYTKWNLAKNSMSRYASGSSGKNGKKKALSDYVKKGYGGSRNAAKSAKSAIRTTINIGDFFGSIANKGINQVLKDYSINTEGRKPKEILSDIINILAPVPDSNDNSVARKALINTMSLIYEKFDDENQDISLLDSLNSDITNMLITKYIETFIYERLIHDVGSRIEKKAENSIAAAKIEKELREYIESKVSVTLEGKPLSIINSQTVNVQVLVEELFQQCYNVLEDQL